MRQKIHWFYNNTTDQAQKINCLLDWREWVSVWRFHANQIPPTHVRCVYINIYVCVRFYFFHSLFASWLKASFLWQELTMHWLKKKNQKHKYTHRFDWIRKWKYNISFKLGDRARKRVSYRNHNVIQERDGKQTKSERNAQRMIIIFCAYDIIIWWYFFFQLDFCECIAVLCGRLYKALLKTWTLQLVHCDNIYIYFFFYSFISENECDERFQQNPFRLSKQLSILLSNFANKPNNL